MPKVKKLKDVTVRSPKCPYCKKHMRQGFIAQDSGLIHFEDKRGHRDFSMIWSCSCPSSDYTIVEQNFERANPQRWVT